ncbi:hypothetical protein APS56_05470 [Pseudalgibacter alginicilyticus]|uniref:Alpha/beta hydrolase n=1 Tax=Pseudalgibacter alginicilyticus TaxID=1736674 RepID=A0A0P0D3M6_9FLAO|nr:DUF6051 family protein [Pseudalgibacter alginicilyticus]ALJ04619.1 hypothetical protein APS56_05470 [Pseudalgibacter alginicilyticus]
MNNKTELKEYKFESLSYNILPGISEYHCVKHNLNFNSAHALHNDVGTIKDNVHIKDISVEENRFFKYHIVKPTAAKNTKKVIFLFHGFNEKDWTKYIPWAKRICEGTASSIVLFPLAFHMQRAPKNWSSKREMYLLSEKRKKRYPNIVHSTLSNVAISMRLHAKPQRFIWSGLQSYYDVIQLIEECKEGKHLYIDKDFQFDIFAYSIGGFLAQILKLTNHNKYFSNSKVCLFCSGPIFNRLSPVSKFILDSETNVALYSFLVEHFDKFLQKDHLLNHYIKEDHLEGKVFYSMLDYQRNRDFREELLRKYENDFYAITLKKDTIIPSFEVINTLKGAYRDINIKVDELDFNRIYAHENPFPLNMEKTELIKKDFEMVFSKVCDFYNEQQLVQKT